MRVDERGDWAAFSPDGRWDCSPGALGRLLFMSDGLRTWKPDPAQDKGFTPGLVDALTKELESIHLTVTTDRGEGAKYRDGEKLTVLVTVDRPVWLRLYHVQEDGQTQMIWPNDHSGDQWIEPATNMQFPAPQGSYSFLVTLPGGVETIIAFASTRHFMPGDPGLPYTGKLDEGSRITRGNPMPTYYPQATATARTSYTVTE
jgi:hypothetical protein